MIIFLVVFKLANSTATNAGENSVRDKRAIGGESLDPSNFVLYEDENTGMRFIEVPYVFMQQSLNDQKMWRTVTERELFSFSLLALSFLVVYCFNGHDHCFLRHIHDLLCSQFSNIDRSVQLSGHQYQRVSIRGQDDVIECHGLSTTRKFARLRSNGGFSTIIHNEQPCVVRLFSELNVTSSFAASINTAKDRLSWSD